MPAPLPLPERSATANTISTSSSARGAPRYSGAPPFAGDDAWVHYQGTTRVQPVWGGKANLAELVVEGPAGRLELLSLRLYEPATGRWHLHVASSRSGELGVPSVGRFVAGRGEFVSREQLDGREVLVRFVISEVSANGARFEQAFSADGGRTWAVNWIATDTRLGS